MLLLILFAGCISVNLLLIQSIARLKKAKHDHEEEDDDDEEQSGDKEGTDDMSIDSEQADSIKAATDTDSSASAAAAVSAKKTDLLSALAVLKTIGADDEEKMEDERQQERHSIRSSSLQSSVTQSARPSWMNRVHLIDPNQRVPVDRFHLHPSLRQVLSKHSINQFFATQSAVIPIILKTHGSNDVCVCSPTGSGKTLAYVIPIIQHLYQRVVRRLRCLVVVPTRDLAVQVKHTFDWFCGEKGIDLKCECAIGQSSFNDEQLRLIQYQRQDGFSGFHLPSSIHSPLSSHSSSLISESAIDILVCTPGRLMDHLHSTNGFTLQHLEYLVIDEVDRLLTQHYQNWIEKVLRFVYIHKESQSIDDDSTAVDEVDNQSIESIATDRSRLKKSMGEQWKTRENAGEYVGVNYEGRHGWMQVKDGCIRSRFANRDTQQVPVSSNSNTHTHIYTDTYTDFYITSLSFLISSPLELN